MMCCRVWSPLRDDLAAMRADRSVCLAATVKIIVPFATDRSLRESTSHPELGVWLATTQTTGVAQTTSVKPGVNPWAVALTVTLATFMELLDTSIANVSLPYIAGGLGRSFDEVTWILTTYLVANAVVLPMSAWLSRVFGRKNYYLGCVALFTISSFCCGIAPSLGFMLLSRVFQGIGGGGLAPVEQAILVDTFPPEKRASAFALYTIAIVTAPAIGPVLGGWITDNYTWRWVFFINIPIGLLSLYLSNRLVQDPPAFTIERKAARAGGRLKIDTTGILLVGLGAHRAFLPLWTRFLVVSTSALTLSTLSWGTAGMASWTLLRP